ncbi:MAG: NAD(+)/NADH kinase [Candidatus Nealsonbacteria bacterium]
MNGQKIDNVLVVCDKLNPKAAAYLKELEPLLESATIGFTEKASAALMEFVDMIVVLGGDGTMLKTVHAYDFKSIFLGINCGHVGFLMNDSNPGGAADRILNGEFEVHRFPLLEIDIGPQQCFLAMNDVYFKSIAGPACKINIKVNGGEIAERVVGDGVVISTAIGSTGYFVPAHGSAINPKIPAIGLAPLHVHTPIQFLPMILPLSSEIELTLLSPKEEVKGFYDGIELPYFQKIKIRESGQIVRLVFWKGESFTARLINKIMRVQEGKNADN